MSDQTNAGVKLEELDDCYLITINRPQKKNALDLIAISEIQAFFDRHSFAKKAVLLTGAEGAFCSGMDLSQKNSALEVMRAFKRLVMAIYNSELIVISAVNGAARGGGLTLTNVSDLAIACPEATFGMPEIEFGVYPVLAAPSTQLITPKKIVAEMVLTGKAISARRALACCLINEIVGAEELISHARSLASHISQFTSEALIASKKGLNGVPFNASDLDAAIDRAIKLNKLEEGKSLPKR